MTSLALLPPEIIAQILHYLIVLKEFRLRYRWKLAIISKSWQLQVERITFAKIKLVSTEVEDFERVFNAYPHRKSVIKQIEYHIILPDHNEQACNLHERKADQQRNNESFTKDTLRLLRLLQNWEKFDGMKDLILNVRAYTRLDIRYRANRNSWTKYDLGSTRYMHSHLDLVGDGLVIPTIDAIKEFRVEGKPVSRHVTGRAMAILLQHFPAVRKIHLVVDDNEKRKPNKRLQLRHDFSLALRDINILNNLVNITLHCVCDQNNDESFQHPSALTRAEGTGILFDHLSLSLHHLSTGPNVKNLYLGHWEQPIAISEDFFWPSDQVVSGHIICWPSLKHYKIHLSTLHPSGQWYTESRYGLEPYTDGLDYIHPETAKWKYERQFAYDSEDDNLQSAIVDNDMVAYDAQNSRLCRAIEGRAYNMFHDHVNHKVMDPLLIAMAKAAKYMPKLKLGRIAMHIPRLRQQHHQPGTTQQDTNGVFQVVYRNIPATQSLKYSTGEPRKHAIVCKEAIEIWRESKRDVRDLEVTFTK